MAAEGIHLANAYVSFSTNTKGLRKDIDKALGASTAGGDKHGRTLGSRVSSGFKKAAGAGFLAAGAVAGTALAKGFGRLRQIDDAQGKLKGLGHSASNVDKIMGDALASVKGTAFGLGDAATVAASTVAAGIKPGKELQDVLTVVADAATIAGTDMGSMGAIFNKVAATGKLQGDEILQLGEAGIPILQFLSKELGVSTEQAQKMASEGKVSFEDFASAMESGLGGAAKESGKTFTGAWKNTMAALGRVGAGALSGIFPQMQKGLGGLTGLFDKMTPVAEAWGEKLSSAIGVVAGGVGGFVKDFRAGEGVAGRFRDALTSAFELVSPYVQKFAGSMAALWPDVKALASTVKDFLVQAFKDARPYLETVATIVGGLLVGAMAALPPILDGIMAGLGGVLNFLKPLLPVLIGMAAAWGAYRLAILGINAVTKIWTGLTVIATGVQKLLNGAMRANPIGLLVAAIMLLVGALVYLYKNNDTARRIMQKAWKAIKSAIKATVDWFKNVAWPAMKTVFTAIGNAGKWLWSKALKPAFKWIKNGAKAVFGWIKDTGWPWVKRAFDNIKAKAKWLWEGMKWAFDKIKGGATSFKVKVGWLRDWIKRYFQAVKGNADWLWDKVKIAFNKLKDGVAAVKRAFGNAKDGIGRAWGKVYGKITSPIKKALRWLNKNFIGKLNTLLGNIPGVSFSIPKINTEGFARGGVLPGYTPMSRGDDVLTPMRSGEGVLVSEGLRDPQSKSMFLAANAAAKRGVPFKDFINQGYAGGGIVALGKRLQRMGYDVSEHPAFGGVVPGAHSANGYHYKGGALDVNADPWNSRFNRETPALDRLNSMLRGEGWNTIWRAPNHWDHLHVDIGNGQGGGLGLGFLKKFLPDWAKDLADNPMGYVKDKIAGFMGKMPGGGKFGLAGKVLPGVVKKMAGGIAQKVKDSFSLSKLLDKFTPDWLSGGDKGGGGSLATRAAVRAVASRYGWGSGAQWNAIDWIVNRESSWDPNAANPTSSARGLFQKMTSIHGPVESTVKGQAEWAMRYFGRRYGSPLGAKAFWERNNWYDSGGVASGVGVMQKQTLEPERVLSPAQTAAFEDWMRGTHLRQLRAPSSARAEESAAIDYDKLARSLAKHVEPAVYRGTYDGAAQQRRNEYIGAASTPRGRRRG